MQVAALTMLCGAFASSFTTTLSAQGDRNATVTLTPTVVVAERSRSSLTSSSAAVSRLDVGALARTPGATLADALRRVPGVALVDADGLGFDPQLMVRGFFGGGQAEYVVLLVDGRPVGQLQSGVIPWSALPPLAAVDAIEVVRGSASALYGDAALGAVINVVTRAGAASAAGRWDASVGAFGTASASAAGSTGGGARAIVGSAGYDRTRGFRAHAARDAWRAQVRVPLLTGGAHELALTLRSYQRTFDEPGPLIASLLATDRAASDVLFRFDRSREASHTLLLDGSRALGAGRRLSGALTGDRADNTVTRTLALAPGYGDTKQRSALALRASGTIQLELDDTPVPGEDHLVVGTDIARGALDSRYYGIAGGDRTAYQAADGARGPIDARSDATRSSAALFASEVLRLSPAVRLTLGARYDWLRDAFTPRGTGAPPGATTTHTAFSPKVGINVRYHDAPGGSGHVYLSAGRSFKAPTLDQLYDQRSIPVPFPPFSITTSNATLRPQSGAGVEGGIYHGLALSDASRASLTLSAYRLDMKDELDFDVATLRYLNIGASRHQGVEAGVAFSRPRAELFANAALQSATSQSGANPGRQLKAIPRRTFALGGSVSASARLEMGAVATQSAGVHLDDASTVALPDFTRVDLRAAYAVLGVQVVLELRNALDARYSTNGFLDPAGSGEAYSYPAAGRVVSLALRSGW